MTLRDARRKRKMTQEALAEASGIDQSLISLIENGRLIKPSWNTVSRLSTALRMKPEELFPVAEHKLGV